MIFPPTSSRDYKSPEYKAWRTAVFKRDKCRCKMPGCTTPKKRCQAHHIKRWADYPLLRFDVNNGITLCTNHHRKVFNKEEQFEAMFLNLISDSDYKYDLWKYLNE